MKRQIVFIATGLLISSCANFEEERAKLFGTQESKDLVTAFEIDKDKAAGFQEKAIDESKEPIESNEKKIKVPEEINLKSKARKVEVKKVDKLKDLKIPKATLKHEVITELTTEAAYPTDYPAHLKEYDKLGKPNWEKFQPRFYQGEQSIIAISYLGVTAGYITMNLQDIVKINDKVAYHYKARFKSAEAYRYFYWLDDSIESFVEKSTFLPIKYSLIQREKKQNVDDLQLFDFKKMKTYTWYKRVKENSNKDEKLDKYIPRYAQDSFSALQFVRGLPLKKGDEFSFSVITRGEPWLLKASVVGEEVISVAGKDVNAIKLNAETHFPGVLQKSGDINFWYSADETRRLLKFKAKIKLGSIYGDLVEFKPGISTK